MNDALQLGLALRDQGIESVARHNHQWLETMRRQARRICMVHGNVTTDDLRRFADNTGCQPAHPNAWGAIFKSAGWKCIGRTQSERPDAHGREIKIWALEAAA